MIAATLTAEHQLRICLSVCSSADVFVNLRNACTCIYTLYIHIVFNYFLFFSSYSVRQQKVERVKLHASNWVGTWSREREGIGSVEYVLHVLKFMAPISDVE